MRILVSIFLLNLAAFPFNLAAMGLSCADPSVIWCVSFQEASGLISRDQSKSGLDVSLVGGPSWVDYRAAIPRASTNSVANIPFSHLFFTPGVGEEATTAASAIFDFSGNKPYMVGIVFSYNTPNPGTGNRQILSHCNVSTGWGLRLNNTTNELNWGYAGVEDFGFSWAPRDSNPHSVFIWRNPVTPTQIRLYIDGKFQKQVTASADIATEGSVALTMAVDNCGNTGEFSGRVSHAQIWNSSVRRHEIDAFALGFHNQFLIGGE